jgi:hypothetical protein
MGSRYRNASSWPAYGNRMEKKLKTICRKKAQAELVPVDPEGKVMGGNQSVCHRLTSFSASCCSASTDALLMARQLSHTAALTTMVVPMTARTIYGIWGASCAGSSIRPIDSIKTWRKDEIMKTEKTRTPRGSMRCFPVG